MNYKEAMAYIEELGSYGIVPGLGNITELCRRLGNPQDALRFVHVAGTNGKGSTIAFMASILECAGYRVGRYTSPAVFEYRERYAVNGRMITQKAFGELLEQVKEACDAMTAEGMPHPTTFEAETALAFLYFKEKACDVVVLETGMGGAMDATNLIKTTDAAVLVSVSMDHMQYLGKTLTEIAGQKAGIIKPGCAVVCAPQKDEVYEVLVKAAEEKACSLYRADTGMLTCMKNGIRKQSFNYKKYKKLEITMAGKYQTDNALTAIEAAEALKDRGYHISEEAVRKGLLQAKWPGRFMVIQDKPMMI
ncbi:MAG: bifunctional folylpolyglutamate synthase/dihydrofolate synthase, partial [Lachnospiraceae bacterium]|nr:bifunctional folylpolyglutamate synthase/dihydrofolate synthase [Lachnospiraceae bacterium]